jgi:hypothetical protein
VFTLHNAVNFGIPRCAWHGISEEWSQSQASSEIAGKWCRAIDSWVFNKSEIASRLSGGSYAV